MATKRRPIHRHARAHLPPHMREKAERLLALKEAHHLAIVDASPENQTFYTDGRHDELLAIAPEIDAALGILPHEDDIAILRAALEAAR